MNIFCSIGIAGAIDYYTDRSHSIASSTDSDPEVILNFSDFSEEWKSVILWEAGF